jgi:HPt (histidine-containing phosphotransfer) domain-containing protein
MVSEANNSGNLHYDPETLISLMNGNESIIKETLELTKKELTKMSHSFLDLSNESDISIFRSIGHKLYGIASLTGLLVLAKLCRELDQSDDIKCARTFAKQIQDEIIEVLRLID